VATVAAQCGVTRQGPLIQIVMDDPPLEFRRGEILITIDRGRINAGAALALLQTTHWAAGLTRTVLERAIENPVCFGFTSGPGPLIYMEPKPPKPLPGPRS
jgi:hypothetical protein